MIAPNGPTTATPPAVADVVVPAHELKRMRFELLSAVQGDLRGGEVAPPADARPRLKGRLVAVAADRWPTLDAAARDQAVGQALDEVCGFGPIQSLLDDPSVTEVMVNRWDKVFAERAGRS